jgi:putative ABC transport system substrate-binding protein
MKRREFITLLGAAVAWPLAARAQQADRVRRVGLLSNIAESDPEAQSMIGAFHQALQELGWVDGVNLRIDRRWGAGNPSRVEALAKELVGLQPEVIVGYTTPAVLALRKEASTIPIVFVQVSDPIGIFLVGLTISTKLTLQVH